MTTSLSSDDDHLSLQVAAGLGSDGVDARVLGVASISSQCDLYHKIFNHLGMYVPFNELTWS